MGHVDDPHDAKGDGKADSSKEIDRRERQRVQRQVNGLRGGDAGLDAVERGPRGVCDGAVGLVIHLVERHARDGILLVPRSHQRGHRARSGECGIGCRTRRIGIQPRCRDTTHTPVDNVRRQSVADRGRGHTRRGQISRHKLRIGRIG